MNRIDFIQRQPISLDKLEKVKSGSKNYTQQEIKRAVQEFEAIFIAMLFKQMQNTVPEDGYCSGDSGTRLYREMMYEELAQSLARAGGIGLGEKLYKDLLEYIGS